MANLYLEIIYRSETIDQLQRLNHLGLNPVLNKLRGKVCLAEVLLD